MSKLLVHVHSKGEVASSEVFEVDENERIVIGDKEFNLKELGIISITDKDLGYNSENIQKLFNRNK